MDGIKYVPLFLDCVAMMRTKNTAEKRMAFLDAIIDYATEGKVPPAPYELPDPHGVDYAAYDGYLMAKVRMDHVLQRIKAGAKGGSSGGRNRSKTAGTKPDGSGRASETPSEPASGLESEPISEPVNGSASESANGTASGRPGEPSSEAVSGIDIGSPSGSVSEPPSGSVGGTPYNRSRNRNMNECVSSRACEEVLPDSDGDSQPDSQPSLPSEDEMRFYAREAGISEAFLQEFLNDMERMGWSYINRGGSQVRLCKRNFRTILCAFHRQRTRAAVSAQGMNSVNQQTILRQEGYDLTKFGE